MQRDARYISLAASVCGVLLCNFVGARGWVDKREQSGSETERNVWRTPRPFDGAADGGVGCPASCITETAVLLCSLTPPGYRCGPGVWTPNGSPPRVCGGAAERTGPGPHPAVLIPFRFPCAVRFRSRVEWAAVPRGPRASGSAQTAQQ
jgi:hypothetical protein